MKEISRHGLATSCSGRPFKALTELRPFVKALNDPEITKLWKLLTISDHFYYMATKFGSIGEVHAYFSPYKNAAIAHGLFMEALSALIVKIAEKIKEKPREILARLVVPENKAFHFNLSTGEYTGLSARSIIEFLNTLDKAPLEYNIIPLE